MKYFTKLFLYNQQGSKSLSSFLYYSLFPAKGGYNIF